MALAGGRRQFLFQVIRFAINGSIVTALLSLVYIAVDSLTDASPQICTFCGYIAALIAGYSLHSRVTFKGHGERNWGSVARFVVGSLPSYFLNMFWTWLLTAYLHQPSWTPLVPIWFVTPFMIFALNRWWVFR